MTDSARAETEGGPEPFEEVTVTKTEVIEEGGGFYAAGEKSGCDTDGKDSALYEKLPGFEMAFEAQNYFGVQKIILKLMGISLYENDSILYRIYSLCSIVFIVVIYTVSESFGLYVFSDDLDHLASVVSYVVTHILGAIKIFVLLKNKKGIQRTLRNLERGIFRPSSERGGRGFERGSILKCIRTTQRQSVAYYASTTTVWLFIMVRTITTRIKYVDYRKWQTPAVPFALFELRKSPDFELACVFQTIGLTIFAAIICSIDLLILGVIVHTKTQLSMLRNSVSRITDDAANLSLKEGVRADPNDPASIPAKYLQLCLGKTVAYHQAIFDLVCEFEEQFNVLILTVFVANTAVLCFAMYHASLYPVSNGRSLQDLTFIITVSMQVFLYCYWGNELALESQRVAWTCYESDFVGASISFQRSLAIVMQRSQKPIVITAGKFTNLSLMTFVAILRVSYSYYMVLRRKNDV